MAAPNTQASTAVGPGTYEDDDPHLTYLPAPWQVRNHGIASGGTFRRAETAGARASLSVVDAASVSITLIKNRAFGKARIWIDEVLVDTVDGYAADGISSEVLGPYLLPDSNEHVVTVQVLGKKNAASDDASSCEGAGASA